MNTLLLAQDTWDLVLDASGNIALAKAPYALAQDVASAIRLFQGELYFNTAPGIPYLTDVLGQLPPLALVRGYLERAALTVPGVVSATAVLFALTDRLLTGQVQFTDTSGAVNTVAFSPGLSGNRLDINFVLNSSPLG